MPDWLTQLHAVRVGLGLVAASGLLAACGGEVERYSGGPVAVEKGALVYEGPNANALSYCGKVANLVVQAPEWAFVDDGKIVDYGFGIHELPLEPNDTCDEGTTAWVSINLTKPAPPSSE